MFAHVQAVVGKCIYCICSCRATLLEIVMRDTSVAHKCYDPGAYGRDRKSTRLNSSHAD